MAKIIANINIKVIVKRIANIIQRELKTVAKIIRK